MSISTIFTLHMYIYTLFTFTDVNFYIIHICTCPFLHYSHLHLSISTLFTSSGVKIFIIHIYTCLFLHYSHLHLAISTLFTFTRVHISNIHIFTCPHHHAWFIPSPVHNSIYVHNTHEGSDNDKKNIKI